MCSLWQCQGPLLLTSTPLGSASQSGIQVMAFLSRPLACSNASPCSCTSSQLGTSCRLWHLCHGLWVQLCTLVISSYKWALLAVHGSFPWVLDALYFVIGQFAVYASRVMGYVDRFWQFFCNRAVRGNGPPRCRVVCTTAVGQK